MMTLAIVLATNSLIAGFLLGHGWHKLTNSGVKVVFVPVYRRAPSLRANKPPVDDLPESAEVDDNADDSTGDTNDAGNGC